MQDDELVNPRCPRISFSLDEIRSFYKPWSRALVVKVLERSFAYPVLKCCLESLWARAGHIQVTDMTNAFFLVRFLDEDDYQKAAFGGPWKIYDYYITVARWSPDFNEDAPIRKILTWVRLPRSSIHYFNATAVERIGNHIGRTVRLDLATAQEARARYVRVCVEVDLSKPLLGKYLLDERVMLIEYESLDNICYSCGMYGHKEADCRPEAPQDIIPTPKLTPTEIVTEEPAGNSGSWMTVTRRNRRGGAKSNPRPTEEKPVGSHFSILSRKGPAEPEVTESASVDASEAGAGTAPVFSEHAAKLSEVLQAAMGSQAPPGSSQAKAASKPVPALRDVSNSKVSRSSPSVISLLDSDSSLVQVLIAYGQPKFTSKDTTPKNKLKSNSKQKENRVPTTDKKQQPVNQKRFVSKKGSNPAGKRGQTESGGGEVPVGLGNGGRPPDVSA
ncbi:hypothetical protein LINPERPRIM_LOCUS29211 [Linum perenne]